MTLKAATRLQSLDGPILITGHTGFKGTWLTRLLIQNGIKVVGYSLPPKKQDLFSRANLAGEVQETFSDIRQLDKLEDFMKQTKPAAIFHLAAQPLVLDSYKDPLGTFETNVIGTANLLEVARHLPSVEAVVVVTTDKVYRNSNSGHRFVENDPLLGNDPYSASKVGTENVALAWQQLIRNDKPSNISVVRSGNVIGGGDFSKDRLLADVVRSHISGTKLTIRNPRSTRPWQHVLDPLHGYVMALSRALEISKGDVFNFGPSESALEVGQVIQIVKNLWEDISIETSPVEQENYESQFLDLNSDYAQEVMFWRPKYSQQEAIESTLRWWDRVLIEKIEAVDAIDEEIHNFMND